MKVLPTPPTGPGGGAVPGPPARPVTVTPAAPNRSAPPAAVRADLLPVHPAEGAAARAHPEGAVNLKTRHLLVMRPRLSEAALRR